MDTIIEIPGDRTASKFAYAAAGLSVVDLAKLGQFIGGALVAGVTVIGRAPKWFRWDIGGAGIAVGATAWAAWPCWYCLAARHLSHRR